MLSQKLKKIVWIITRILSFFCKMADAGRRINHIGRQKDEERVLVDLAEMKGEVASHFEKLFTK